MEIKDERFRTMLVITLGLLIYYFIWPNQFFLSGIILVLAIASLSSKFCLVIHVGWMKLAEILGYIIPNLLLTLIFYFILFPTAQMAKLFRSKDLLGLKNSKPTTFLVRNKKFIKDDFLNPW